MDNVKVTKDAQLTEQNKKLYEKPTSEKQIIEKFITTNGDTKKKVILRRFYGDAGKASIKNKHVGLIKNGKVIFNNGIKDLKAAMEA